MSEKLVIVFPTNIADAPNTMLDFIPITNNPDTYYIYSIGDFIGGASRNCCFQYNFFY